MYAPENMAHSAWLQQFTHSVAKTHEHACRIVAPSHFFPLFPCVVFSPLFAPHRSLCALPPHPPFFFFLVFSSPAFSLFLSLLATCSPRFSTNCRVSLFAPRCSLAAPSASHPVRPLARHSQRSLFAAHCARCSQRSFCTLLVHCASAHFALTTVLLAPSSSTSRSKAPFFPLLYAPNPVLSFLFLPFWSPAAHFPRVFLRRSGAFARAPPSIVIS